MKKRIGVIIIIVSIAIALSFIYPKKQCQLSQFQMRAVWFSYLDLQEFSYENKENFIHDFQQALDNIENIDTNTIIVQVRAFSDALYVSKLFPLSTVIAHKAELTFDPLEEMIKIAHQRKLKIEAWINPYRISLSQKTYEQFQNYSIKKQWLNQKEKTIKYGEYKYIFNPASLEARNYIVSGVEEIVKNYDVDGIHFDDYFYVSGTHGKTTQDERMDYVNMLIQDVYQTIKKWNKNIKFGISPQGNYENCIREGADIDTWLNEEGFIDYLMPQIYWSDTYGEDGKTKMFTQRTKFFSKLKRNRRVSIYGGLALYNCGENLKLDKGWSLSSSNISSQIQILYENGYKGYALFRYNVLKKAAVQKELNTLLKQHSYS